MRIAVSGAHGVGKTTFCNDLADALKNKGFSVEIKTDVARSLREEGVPINRGTEESQYPLFLERHLANLLDNGDSDFVVYDRTMLDTIAYATANGNLGDQWLSFLRKAATPLLHSIDTYFYIPIEFEIENDGVRATEREYQTEVDKALTEILKECRPNFITLTGGRDERVAEALRSIPTSIGSMIA